MAGRRIQPFRFMPRSVVDALDGGQVAPGGMSAATNLIFDVSNPFTLSCRPAALSTYNFSGLNTPGAVSVAYQVGDICYGMIDTAAVPGYEQPFAYNVATNTLVTVSGTQNSTTLPTTASTSGAWTPPTMSLVGVNLYVTHPGFVGGGSAFFGWFDTTNPAAPVWHAGNTTTNPLPSVPTAVTQFNLRAWFACKNVVFFTDTLSTTISAASQSVTVGDSEPITALAQQPLITSVQGQIQSLIVFKESIFSIITGDLATGDLAQNINSSEVGTTFPRTVCSTPRGVMFATNDGVRIIGHDGIVGEPNQDLKNPFIFALTPSRASACYNNNIYRITVQNGHENGNPLQEYWFDIRANGWTGPHTFTQSMAVPYLKTFICFSNDIKPKLFTSDVVQSGTSTFVENGVAMSFLERTAPMQDDGNLYQNSANLTVIDMQIPQAAQSYSFAASDATNGVLSTASLTTSSTGAIWNGFVWANATWTATSYGLGRYNIPWKDPLVFSRLVFQISGPAVLGVKIGKITVGYQPLKYVRIP